MGIILLHLTILCLRPNFVIYHLICLSTRRRRLFMIGESDDQHDAPQHASVTWYVQEQLFLRRPSETVPKVVRHISDRAYEQIHVVLNVRTLYPFHPRSCEIIEKCWLDLQDGAKRVSSLLSPHRADRRHLSWHKGDRLPNRGALPDDPFLAAKIIDKSAVIACRAANSWLGRGRFSLRFDLV